MKKKNNAPEKRNVKIVHAVATVWVPVAPRKFKSKHKTLEEWLFAICEVISRKNLSENLQLALELEV
jgi:hypothetical protein